MDKTTDRAAEAPATEASTTEASTAEAVEAAAGAQLSTAPLDDAPGPVGIGVLGWVRWFWRQLTSMRVALILLLLLSLGAIPGSLLPQNSVDLLKVSIWKGDHPKLTPIYEKLQLFDVYSSVWFSAIYILLFVSLIGCIVPRTWQFVGQLRSRPPGAPRYLDKMPAFTTWHTESSPEEVLDAAGRILKKRRFRTAVSGTAVSAEKGYLREAGNLAFHVALIVLLVAFAWGRLFFSEGGKLILQGGGFANTLTQYDDFKSGSLFSSDDLPPFSFTLDRFDATYERTGPQKGTAREFRAFVTYSKGADGAPVKSEIQVNEPLEIEGSKIYLLGHGYAPVISVTDPRGKVVFKDAVPMLPQDSNLTSTGAVKVIDGYRDKDGKKEQLGFSGVFVPTFAGAGRGTMFSQYPGLDFPALALTGYHGSLGVDAGLPQNVYQLDTTKMKQYKDKDGKPFAVRMLPGESMTLPNGAGTVKFEGISTWATFSITHQPGSGPALLGAVAAILGLAGSLFIQRRRVWVRAVAGPDGTTLVEMAGLGRSESAKLPEELADLALTLNAEAPTAPRPVDSATGADTDSGTAAEADTTSVAEGERA